LKSGGGPYRAEIDAYGGSQYNAVGVQLNTEITTLMPVTHT